MKANASRRDPDVIEVRWQSGTRFEAIRQIERLSECIPAGYREELVAYRRRKGHGQRRSCTLQVRYIDRRAGRYTPEAMVRHFQRALTEAA